MRKILLLALLALVLLSVSYAEERFAVIVILKEDQNFINSLESTSPNVDKLKVQKAMNIYQTDKVLADLGYKTSRSNEFQFKHRFDALNGFSAIVNKQGLGKLASHPLIESLELDQPAYASAPPEKSEDLKTLVFIALYSSLVASLIIILFLTSFYYFVTKKFKLENRIFKIIETKKSQKK